MRAEDDDDDMSSFLESLPSAAIGQSALADSDALEVPFSSLLSLSPSILTYPLFVFTPLRMRKSARRLPLSSPPALPASSSPLRPLPPFLLPWPLPHSGASRLRLPGSPPSLPPSPSRRTWPGTLVPPRSVPPARASRARSLSARYSPPPHSSPSSPLLILSVVPRSWFSFSLSHCSSGSGRPRRSGQAQELAGPRPRCSRGRVLVFLQLLSSPSGQSPRPRPHHPRHGLASSPRLRGHPSPPPRAASD